MMAADPTSDLTFEAPGPGAWELEMTHRGHRPLTPFPRSALLPASRAGLKVLVQQYGLPLETIAVKLVHGCLYLRPIGLGEREDAKPKPLPPVFVMKIVARLHPGMRRRNRAAAAAWRERRWRTEVDRWFDHDRAVVIATNLTYQRVDLEALAENELLDHARAVLDNFATQVRLNFATHGADLIPAGDFLAHCRRWGIADADATALLQGSSPATLETTELLAPVAQALAGGAPTPGSVDEIRSLGRDAAAAVDAWLELHGWRLVTSDDIDKPTMAERPALQLTALLAAAERGAPAAPDPAALRNRVPVAERDTFDALLAEARYGMRQRDDNAGVRWNWSGGLLRRALLEAGGRLVDKGLLTDREHVVELTPEELGPLLLTGTGPGPEVIADRAAYRDRVENAPPPALLGEPEAPPPVDALPAPLARATAALLAVIEAEGSPGADGPTANGQVCGIGVGSVAYHGIARVATSADDALDRLEPGDVLVAPFTGPSYNSILPILGALVVDAGGTMSHAAIVAREFELPAVIGAAGATTRIPDGALVEVDPGLGCVRILS